MVDREPIDGGLSALRARASWRWLPDLSGLRVEQVRQREGWPMTDRLVESAGMHCAPINCHRRDGWDWPHGGPEDVAEPVTDRLAVLPDGIMLRRSPPEQPDVDDVLSPGSLIRTSYSDRTKRVFKIAERECYGLPTHTIAIDDPDKDAREDGLPKNYRGGNIKELVYQDGEIRMLFLENKRTVEAVGHDEIEVDYQATISAGWSA